MNLLVMTHGGIIFTVPVQFTGNVDWGCGKVLTIVEVALGSGRTLWVHPNDLVNKDNELFTEADFIIDATQTQHVYQ